MHTLNWVLVSMHQDLDQQVGQLSRVQGSEGAGLLEPDGARRGLGTAVAWIERVLRALDRFQQGHTVLGFPVAVAKKYGDDQAGKHAALLAYYGFLSLFPLLLVFVTLLGYALANNQELQQHIIDTLIAQFPVLGSQIQDSITTIQGSGIGLVVGILGTLWGGLGITQSAQDEVLLTQ